MALASASFEQLTVAAFRRAPERASLPPLAARAIAGGARHIVCERVRAGRAHELRGLTGELLDWAVSYATPLAGRLASLGARAPARHTPVANGAVVAPPGAFLLTADARTRAMEALTLLVLERGEGGLSDADVARRAGMSTDALHREFASAEACYLALLDDFAAEGAVAARAASAAAENWAELVLQAMDGFLSHMLDRPELVRIAFVHVFATRAATSGRLTRTVAPLVELVTDGAPARPRGATVLRPALEGALWTILASCATGERLARLARLVHQLAFVVVAPYLGPRAAVQALASARLPASAR